MELQYQVLPLSFKLGLETKVDSKQISTGQLLVLQNGIFISPQEITKRNGFLSLSNSIIEGGTITTGNMLSTFDNALILANGMNLYNYSPTETSWNLSGTKQQGSIKSFNLGALAASGTAFIAYSNPSGGGPINYGVAITPTLTASPSVSTAISPAGIQVTAWVQTSGGNVLNTNQSLQRLSIGVTYFDTNTNVVIGTSSINITGSEVWSVKVNFVNNQFVLFVLANTSSLAPINPNVPAIFNYILSPTVPPPSGIMGTGLLTLAGTNNGYASSIDTVTVGNNVYIMYQSTAGGPAVSIYSGGTLTTTTQISATAVSTLQSIEYDSVGNFLWAYYYNPGGGTIAVTLNLALAITNTILLRAPVTADALTPVTAAGFNYGTNQYIIYISYPNIGQWTSGSLSSQPPTNYPSHIYKVIINKTTFTVTSAYLFMNDVVLSAKPFLNGDGNAIIPAQYNYCLITTYTYASTAGSNLYAYYYGFTAQPTYFVIQDKAPNRIQGATTLPTPDYSIISHYSDSTAPLQFPSSIDKPLLINGVYSIPYLIATDTSSVGLTPYFDGVPIASYTSPPQPPTVISAVTSNYNVALLNLSFSQKLRANEIGENLNINGLAQSIFDNSGVAESGYNVFPEPVTGLQYPAYTAFPVSNGHNYLNFDVGTSYEYLTVYNWVDDQGNVHRSAPSIPAQALGQNTATAGTSTVILPIYVKPLYLSEEYKISNVTIDIYRTTNGGTIFYKLTSLNNTTPTTNPLSLLLYNDQTRDGVLVGNEQLYTTGGEVENLLPPASNLQVSYKSRLILVDAQNPYNWWYSKQVIPGFPTEYNDAFVQTIDPKGGPITAVSTMDDKLVFFKGSNIWYVIGDGPAPSGANNDFTYPQIISSDTGCVNQDSIVLTPQGLMFQSPKGIYLLGRGLDLNYIGAPVEALTNNATVTSAQMIANTNQIRFTMSSGIALVLDYHVGQWSTFTNVAAVDSVIYNSNHSYLTSAGIVNEESPGQYLDQVNTPIALSLTTGWLSFGNVQGFQRVKKFLTLIESVNNDTLQVQLNYDYNRYSADGITIPVVGNSIPQQYRIFPQWQKCENMQLVLTEVPSTTSTSFKLSELMLEVAVKKGAFKLSAGNSYG